jgi:hypothetical protein
MSCRTAGGALAALVAAGIIVAGDPLQFFDFLSAGFYLLIELIRHSLALIQYCSGIRPDHSSNPFEIHLS